MSEVDKREVQIRPRKHPRNRGSSIENRDKENDQLNFELPTPAETINLETVKQKCKTSKNEKTVTLANNVEIIKETISDSIIIDDKENIDNTNIIKNKCDFEDAKRESQKSKNSQISNATQKSKKSQTSIVSQKSKNSQISRATQKSKDIQVIDKSIASKSLPFEDIIDTKSEKVQVECCPSVKEKEIQTETANEINDSHVFIDTYTHGTARLTLPKCVEIKNNENHTPKDNTIIVEDNKEKIDSKIDTVKESNIEKVNQEVQVSPIQKVSVNNIVSVECFQIVNEQQKNNVIEQAEEQCIEKPNEENIEKTNENCVEQDIQNKCASQRNDNAIEHNNEQEIEQFNDGNEIVQENNHFINQIDSNKSEKEQTEIFIDLNAQEKDSLSVHKQEEVIYSKKTNSRRLEDEHTDEDPNITDGSLCNIEQLKHIAQDTKKVNVNVPRLEIKAVASEEKETSNPYYHQNNFFKETKDFKVTENAPLFYHSKDKKKEQKKIKNKPKPKPKKPYNLNLVTHLNVEESDLNVFDNHIMKSNIKEPRSQSKKYRSFSSGKKRMPNRKCNYDINKKVLNFNDRQNIENILPLSLMFEKEKRNCRAFSGGRCKRQVKKVKNKFDIPQICNCTPAYTIYQNYQPFPMGCPGINYGNFGYAPTYFYYPDYMPFQSYYYYPEEEEYFY